MALVAPDDGKDAGPHLVGIIGLGDGVIGAQAESAGPLLGVTASQRYDRRIVAGGAQAADEAEAVLAQRSDVDENKVAGVMPQH